MMRMILIVGLVVGAPGSPEHQERQPCQSTAQSSVILDLSASRRSGGAMGDSTIGDGAAYGYHHWRPRMAAVVSC
jgi:hypothetical protein